MLVAESLVHNTGLSIELKTKIVLKAIKDDKSINEMLVNINIQNWKVKFLANAEMAMEGL